MKEAKAETGYAGREKEKKPSASAGSSLAGLTALPGQTKSFLQDVRMETKRVTWPTAKQIRATTLVVLITVFFFGIYFGVLDWIYTSVIGWLFKLGS
jgi:preprotein translocase subunit SecE